MTIKNKKKIFEVDVLVYTTVCVPIEAKDEDDARKKVSYEISDSYSSQKHFLRMNACDFINYSFFDDYDFWSVRDATEDYIEEVA
tara:strand:- start:863 stop:1117 length:255 start_codon:yes stop_codon:yes gene_type:complete